MYYCNPDGILRGVGFFTHGNAPELQGSLFKLKNFFPPVTVKWFFRQSALLKLIWVSIFIIVSVLYLNKNHLTHNLGFHSHEDHLKRTLIPDHVTDF